MAVNPHTEPAKMEQIITEFFAKSLHIILESRYPYVSSRNYSTRPRDKWFNLALRDCPAALENIDFWRRSNLEPMVVDVVLVQRNWDYASSSPRVALERNHRFPFIWKSESDEFGSDGNTEKIIERWVVQYESMKGCKETCSGSKRSSSISSHALYKKSILLLRSLYVTVRLLPGYKIFREINSSGQIRSFNLIHKVSSSVEPLIRRDEAEMQQFTFTPVETSCGKLYISLLYLPSISDTTSESSTPMSRQFIPDYVCSPLADPLNRLPSVPMPQYSPSSSPYGRHHSWSYDTAAPPPSALPSPSPTYSESRTLHSKFGNHRPPTSSRHPSSEIAQVHNKDTGYDVGYTNSVNLESFLIPLKEINLATQDFSPETRIGDGGFGMVHKGQLSELWQNRTVAIKRLDLKGYQGKDEFLTELKLISKFQHENIIRFVGYCDQGEEMILIYEYASNGSLDHHLQDANKRRNLKWTKRLNICLGAARGLDYLHSGLGEDKRVIHRDIKSGNILLDENLDAKICDFGLSKESLRNQEDSSQVYTKVAGTNFYLDPIYLESGILRKESDVYSFGVVLFEMLSGMLVYHRRSLGDGKPQTLINLARRYYRNRLERLIDPLIRDQIDNRCFHTFEDLAYKCISYDSWRRPTMDIIIKTIEDAIDSQVNGDPLNFGDFVEEDYDKITTPTVNASPWRG